MHDRPQMPPTPEGCVYGPWWADEAEYWVALFDDGTDGSVGISCWEGAYWSEPEYGLEIICLSAETLRLATELAQREARVKELEKELEWRVRADEK